MSLQTDAPTLNGLSISIIIPTFNGAKRIRSCLTALLPQAAEMTAEILVVDDGSTDNTAAVVAEYPNVRLIMQQNGGPAVARNRGAIEAKGNFLLFTDDDCVPNPDWLLAMLLPFGEAAVVGAKGVYLTHQKQIVARFVQLEYEDKYRYMSSSKDIDFIDTYSGAYRREHFLEMKGYDTSFPVACAEDVELSYRMSARGWKMRFAPLAVVYHTHPASLTNYLKKKYKFAYWRMLAVRKNPSKAVSDSHTPQLMKMQMLFLPLLLLGAAIDVLVHPTVSVLVTVAVVFFLTTIPFVIRSSKKDGLVALVSPFLLAARAYAQFFGVLAGISYAFVTHVERKVHPAVLK